MKNNLDNAPSVIIGDEEALSRPREVITSVYKDKRPNLVAVFVSKERIVPEYLSWVDIHIPRDFTLLHRHLADLLGKSI